MMSSEEKQLNTQLSDLAKESVQGITLRFLGVGKKSALEKGIEDVQKEFLDLTPISDNSKVRSKSSSSASSSTSSSWLGSLSSDSRPESDDFVPQRFCKGK